jgi:hypothetical protein
MWQELPTQAIQQNLEAAARVLSSPGIQDHVDAIRRANEIIESRFGPVWGSPSLPSSAFQASTIQVEWPRGLEDAVARISPDLAGEVLRNAAELASSAAVREMIEQADEDALIELWRRVEVLWNKAAAVTDAGLEATLSRLSREQLVTLLGYVLLTIRIFYVGFVFGLLLSNPIVTPENFEKTLGILIVLFEAVKAVLEKKDEN